MATVLDVFNSDYFGLLSLTDGINKMKFQPGRIGQMGIFQEIPIATLTVALEERDGIINLISPSARGGPGQTLTKSLRTARAIRTAHFQVDDAIMAEEVQGVRVFGSENATEAVMTKVAERQQVAGVSLEATLEYARIGAVKGIVTYADSTTQNLFDLFEISAPAERDMDLDNASPTSGVQRKNHAALIRDMSETLGGSPFTGIRAICGDAYFDDLLAHPEVRNTYLNTPAAEQLRQSYVSNGMIYGAYDVFGVMYENYRGAVGGTSFIDTNKAYFFPVGVPGLFKTFISPADYVETVNTLGQRLYSKVFPMENDKGVNMETQMNFVNICTRPNVLFSARRT